jgi:hypothetical protein
MACRNLTKVRPVEAPTVAEAWVPCRQQAEIHSPVRRAFHKWEKQRWVLHQVSKDWIKHGRVAGLDRGEFFVDTEGSVSAEPR